MKSRSGMPMFSSAAGAVLAVGLSVCVCRADEAANLLTRSQIVAPAEPGEFGWPPERLYAEVDLTGDGLDEIIISDSVSTAGTGGLEWSLYRAVASNQYSRAVFKLDGARILAVEADLDARCRGGKARRLWTYWHMSARSGLVGYVFCNDNGEFERGPALEVFTGDGGTETGDGIYSAIFAPGKCLELKSVGRHVEPAARGR